jgi:hypothetical protein
VTPIPPDLLQDVVNRAETIHREEAKWMADLRQGESLSQAKREA